MLMNRIHTLRLQKKSVSPQNSIRVGILYFTHLKKMFHECNTTRNLCVSLRLTSLPLVTLGSVSRREGNKMVSFNLSQTLAHNLTQTSSSAHTSTPYRPFLVISIVINSVTTRLTKKKNRLPCCFVQLSGEISLAR